ncbi:MAG: energy-coupling factor transporter transmembrane component T [Candidatus Aenigmarchaeota archaeon]
MLAYHKGQSTFHQLDPRTKLFFFVFLSILCLLSVNTYYLLTIFVFVFLVFLANRLPFRELKDFSKIFIILSILVIIIQGFFYPLGQTALYRILDFTLTLEGVVFGIGISFRLFILLFAVSILMLTNRPKEMMESLGNFLPKDLAFSLTTAFRFIPIFQSEIKTIMISQESRGLRKRGPKKITAYFPIIVPLFAKALTRARNLAVSVESRGFGKGKTKYDLKMKTKDWLVIFGTLAFGTFLVIFHLV